MEWRIEKVGNNRTIDFAADELKKYLCKIDQNINVAVLKTQKGSFNNTLQLYVDCSFAELPKVEDEALDDAYSIKIKNGMGYICGTNHRSVLLGVYRFLSEIGCFWPYAGADGEFIPKKDLSECDVCLTDKASYRHRGVCIEGSVSYMHVLNMIDWLPKVGMNAYFNQFMVPLTFFERWYNVNSNPYLHEKAVTIDEVRAMVKAHEDEIKKRGMLYHATGHGWTCEPFGIEGNSWDRKDYVIADEYKDLLAMMNGKRDWFDKLSLCTNLCYSNKKAQEIMVVAIVDYCEKHPDIDYLHFWLADAANNHCECEECQKMRPSDFYVQILNEIDRRLSEKNIPTKIVMLIYLDLLWEPEYERLQNIDRFTLMFAPITRTYSSPLCESLGEPVGELSPYVRNKLTMPSKTSENVARLTKWQELFCCDGFDFDYHMMNDHLLDLGGYANSKILYEDMQRLDEIGLNGMMSCQVQRAFFPTGLIMYAMASALWDKSKTFEQVATQYFKDLFKENGEKMQNYFKTLSELFDPPYMRFRKPVVNEESASNFAKISMVVNEMLPFILNKLETETDKAFKKQWEILNVHAGLCLQLSDALEQRAKGNFDYAAEKWQKIEDYIYHNEQFIHNALDIWNYGRIIGDIVKRH